MRGLWRASEAEASVYDSLVVSHTTILANQRKRDTLTLYGTISRGEPLPDFPTPTHSYYAYCDELGLQRWNTFQGAIDGLEDSAPNHLLMHRRKIRRNEDWAKPNPPDWPCHGAITTGEYWPDH